MILCITRWNPLEVEVGLEHLKNFKTLLRSPVNIAAFINYGNMLPFTLFPEEVSTDIKLKSINQEEYGDYLSLYDTDTSVFVYDLIDFGANSGAKADMPFAGVILIEFSDPDHLTCSSNGHSRIQGLLGLNNAKVMAYQYIMDEYTTLGVNVSSVVAQCSRLEYIKNPNMSKPEYGALLELFKYYTSSNPNSYTPKIDLPRVTQTH